MRALSMSSKVFVPFRQSYAAPVFDIKERITNLFGAFEKADRAPERLLHLSKGGSGIVRGSQHSRDCKGVEHCASDSEPMT
jgi:hypothetical protein